LQRLDLDIELLEVRADTDDDGPIIEGRIVPYGEEIEVDGEREAFAPGVFADTDPDSVVLLWQHDKGQPIGRGSQIWEQDDGAYMQFRMATTARAVEAHTLARDRVARGLSIGFLSEQATRKGRTRTHRKARLLETSLVTFPAYPSAEVLAARSKEDQMPETDEIIEAVEDTPAPVVNLAPIEIRLDGFGADLREVRSQLAHISLGKTAAEPEMTVREALVNVLKTVASKEYTQRALADVIGTPAGNADGLVQLKAWGSEVLGILNVLRPMFSAAGTVPFPASGYGLGFPRITQHTQVAKRTGEKVEVASRELTVDAVTYQMEWFAGAVDVSLELIEQSDPSVAEIVVSVLLDQYAIVTEAEFVADATAAATVGGAVLDTATWAGFVADVIATAAAIKDATGVPGNMLGLTDASWSAFLGLLNPSQPSISFGSSPDFTAESANVGGITVFHAADLTADIQFNQKALRNAEKPPLTVTANNVALMGRDIGVLGATIAIPAYPAGIVKYTAT
jgi:HK97 family phage prohead protease